VLNRRAIGRSASVAAVRVGAKMYVLGVTDQRIEKLDECDAPEFDLEIDLPSEFDDGDDDDGFERVGRARDVRDQRKRGRTSFLDSLRERTVR
jgi:flagellar biogenesis protein FliO